MARLLVIVLALFATVLVDQVSAESARYDNYRVYLVTANNASQADVLRTLEATSDGIKFADFAFLAGRSLRVAVAPHKLADFGDQMRDTGIRYELLDTNLQAHIDNEHVFTSRALTEFNWQQFHPLPAIHKWLDDQVAEYSKVLTPLSAGKSYEGRDLKGVKLSHKPGNPGIFIEGGIHAREWISPATVTYILNELLTSDDPAVRAIAENYDWYIFPNVNPDGYVYTHGKDRLWRKTRKPHGLCRGADPNRNWGFHWAEQGTSSVSCSETYGGPKAFSEPETEALSAFIKSLQGKVQTYIAFHSYSQLILFPYGHTAQHAENHNDLMEIGETAAKALAKRYGTQYTVGNVYEAIYPASGSSVDWAFANVDIPISYTYELRPSSRAFNGFVLPPAQIVPTGEETLDSIVAMIGEIQKRGYFSK